MSKPVIFLAFANDKVDYARYLRELPLELRLIRDVFENLKENGFCEIIERANCTIEDIFKIFQKNEVTIFHYGGHADGYQLILEAADGSNEVAHAEGLVSFLSRQKDLKLLFLNGCTTKKQAQELADKCEDKTVIATNSKIDDSVAQKFAECFYQGIAENSTIEKAYLDAKDLILTKKGTQTQNLYRYKKEAEDLCPWQIFGKNTDWNLGIPKNTIETEDLPIIEHSFLQSLDWTQALRPTATRKIANDLLIHKEAINLIGEQGTGRRRMAEDLQKILKNIPFVKICVADINLYAQSFEGFRKHLATMLQTPTDLSFDKIMDYAAQKHYVILFLNRFERIYEKPETLDPIFDKTFLEQLNGLRNTNRVFMLCTTEKGHKTYKFRGQGSWLQLKEIDLPKLSHKDLEKEIKRSLPLFSKKNTDHLLFLLQTETKPYALLEYLCRNLGNTEKITTEILIEKINEYKRNK